MQNYQLLSHRGIKKGELAYHIADYTPINRSNSWTDKLCSAAIAARCGGKTNIAMLYWEDECNKLFPRKRTKLLQSKGKCPRMVKVTVNYNK